MKICTKCKQELDESLFGKQKGTKSGIRAICKNCANSLAKKRYWDNPEKSRNAQREYREKNPDKYKEYYQANLGTLRDKGKIRARIARSKWTEAQRSRANQIRKDSRSTVKEKFLKMYGSKCTCCGELDVRFLTIEHILGQVGKKKQGSHRSYNHAIKEYRPDLYEILCYNCNCAKFRNGGICPHRTGEFQ